MLALLALAALAVTASARVVNEPRLGCGSGWIVTGRAEADTTHSVRIAITGQNTEELERIALAVSDPRSPQYGEHLSKDEVNELTAPRPEDVAAVVEWLYEAEVAHTVNADHGTVTIRDSVAKVEALFKTRISTAVNPITKQTARRAGDYEIPTALEGAIAAVFGMHGLPVPPRSKISVSGSGPPTATPQVIAEAYNISGVKVSGSLKNRQAAVQFDQELANLTDLRTFFKLYLPHLPAADAELYATHGVGKKVGTSAEADLDFMMLMGVAPGVKTEEYLIPGEGSFAFCAQMHNWTEMVLSAENPPLVHSISYGLQRNISSGGDCGQGAAVVEANLAKLAARGISVIIASGDAGSGYTRVPAPILPDCDPHNPGTTGVAMTGEVLWSQELQGPGGQHDPSLGAFYCCNIAQQILSTDQVAGWTFVDNSSSYYPKLGTCTVFKSLAGNESKATACSGTLPPPPPGIIGELFPEWPATSKWVTAVGATRFIDDVPLGPEGAVTIEDEFGSGGGFSWLWDAPEWQKEAIAHYFKTVDPSTLPDKAKVRYTTTGRGTPDVAALGTGIATVVDGTRGRDKGTSASAPIFAAIVSLLNEARLQAGKKPLGFLNPWLYQNPDAFHDVTVGWGRVGGAFPIAAGYNCTAGWDPVTGLGTPNFPKLLAAALAAK